MSKNTTLKAVKNGTKVTIINLPTGECRRRLEALGLQEGKIVTKVSGMPFYGPVCLALDGRQIAVGRKMALRIEVSLLKDETKKI